MSSTTVRARTRAPLGGTTTPPAATLADPLASQQLADPLCDPLSDPLAAPVQMCEDDDCSDVEILAHHAATTGDTGGPSLVPDLRQPEAADIPASAPQIDPSFVLGMPIAPSRIEDLRAALDRPLVEEMPDPHSVSDPEERGQICEQLHPMSDGDLDMMMELGEGISDATDPDTGYCATEVLQGDNPAEAGIRALAEPFTPSLPVGDVRDIVDLGVDAVTGNDVDANDAEWSANPSGALSAHDRLVPESGQIDDDMGRVGFALDAIDAATGLAEVDACSGEASRRRVEANHALDEYLEAHPEARRGMPPGADVATQRRILEQRYERINGQWVERQQCLHGDDDRPAMRSGN